LKSIDERIISELAAVGHKKGKKKRIEKKGLFEE